MTCRNNLDHSDSTYGHIPLPVGENDCSQEDDYTTTTTTTTTNINDNIHSLL